MLFTNISWITLDRIFSNDIQAYWYEVPVKTYTSASHCFVMRNYSKLFQATDLYDSMFLPQMRPFLIGKLLVLGRLCSFFNGCIIKHRKNSSYTTIIYIYVCRYADIKNCLLP